MNIDLGFAHHYTRSSNGSQRVILALHGTGGDENSLVPIAKMVAPDASILSVRGKVLENGASRFFRRISEGVFDLDDLRLRTSELVEFIEKASQIYGFDRNHLTALGYSNGANIASSILLTRPESFANAILIRAMVPFEPDAPQDLQGKRLFISEGKFDPIVPLGQGNRLAEIFRSQGADVTLLWNDLDHRMTKSEIDAARDWLG